MTHVPAVTPAVATANAGRSTRIFRPTTDAIPFLVSQFPAGPFPPALATEPAPVPGEFKTITLDSEAHGYGDACLTSWISEGSRNPLESCPESPWKLVHRARRDHFKAVMKVGPAGQDIADSGAILIPAGSSVKSGIEVAMRFIFALEKDQTSSPAILALKAVITRDFSVMKGDAVYDHNGVTRRFSFRGTRSTLLGVPPVAKPESPLGSWKMRFDLPGGTFNESPLVLSIDHGKAGFLEMLGQEVDDEIPAERCVTTFSCYNLDELEKERGTVPRVLSRARSLGIYSPPKRPERISISQDAHDWADKIVDEYPKLRTGEAKLILLFPQTCYTSREWPAAYWTDTAWKLHEAGHAVITMLDHRDSRHLNTPRHIWGTGWHHLAALMLRSDLVIGNDSGPANVSGTLGVPTLALMGPTNPAIFAHVPEVECLRVYPDELPCIGCHFGKPFRAACDQGCQGLLALKPDRVRKRIAEMLG